MSEIVVTVTIDGRVEFIGSPQEHNTFTITRRLGEPAWFSCGIPDLSASRVVGNPTPTEPPDSFYDGRDPGW